MGLFDGWNPIQAISTGINNLTHAGSVQDAVGAITRGTKDTVGNTIGGLFTGDEFGLTSGLNQSGSQPSAPGADPAIADQAAAQKKQADDFEKNMPKMNQDIMGTVASGERRNLANQMTGIKEKNSSRGMLYSGINQSQQLGAQANSGSRMAAAQQSINSDLNQHLQDMKDMSITSGLNVQQQQQNISNQIYGTALMNMQNNINAYGSMGSGIGKMAGYGAANGWGGGSGSDNTGYGGGIQAGNMSGGSPNSFLQPLQ